MGRPDLILHLRHDHGYEDLEPGGRHHDPLRVGLPCRLDDLDDEQLEFLHDADHEASDHEEGT